MAKARILGNFEYMTDMQFRELAKSCNAIETEQITDGNITLAKLYPGILPASQRQIVWQGYKSYTTDNSLYLTPVTGQLKITLLASTVPFICCLSGGYDVLGGQIDYLLSFSTDVIGAWTLPANKAYLELYIDYDPATGTTTFPCTELETAYWKPSSPSNDQHWYDKGNLKIMQVYNSSTTTWDKKIRVKVGEATTGASSVTSVISRAIQDQFDSWWIAVAGGSVKTLNHNIGLRIPEGLQITWGFSLDANGLDSSYAHDMYINGVGAGTGHCINEDVAQVTRNTIKFGFGTNIQLYRNAYRTSGYYRTIIRRSWT